MEPAATKAALNSRALCFVAEFELKHFHRSAFTSDCVFNEVCVIGKEKHIHAEPGRAALRLSGMAVQELPALKTTCPCTVGWRWALGTCQAAGPRPRRGVGRPLSLGFDV